MAIILGGVMRLLGSGLGASDEGPRQRRPVLPRTPDQTRPVLYESLHPRHLKHRHQITIAVAERPQLFFQRREKIALKAPPIT